ncbi:MAG: hypothetical protein WC260_03905 [Candidatus Pacearchaeota archaeon]
MWYDKLSLRGVKELKTRGELYAKLFTNYKKMRDKSDTRSMAVKDVAVAVGLTDSRLQAFFGGMFEDVPTDTFVLLLGYIKLDMAAFNNYGKNTSIPGLGVFSEIPVTKPAAPVAKPAAPVAKPAAPVAKPAAPAQTKMQIENYVEEPLVIYYDASTNTLAIHPNYAENKLPKDKKVILLHNAVIFAGKVVPGKASL